MKNTLSPANKPAQDFTCVLQELRQPDSRAFCSWDDAQSIRDAIETDSRPLPAAAGCPGTAPESQHQIREGSSFAKKLSPANAASRNWHQRKATELRAAGLNWRGEPYRNERQTRPLVHPDLPPKLYLDHAAYMAAWRAKRKSAK